MKNKTTLTSCWKAAFLPVLFFLGPLEVSAFQPSESASPFDLSVNKKEQNIINGTIKSEEDGQPLPGATILIKGSNAGTVSDLDGNFTITVPDESAIRSEERRVGKECRSRWSQYHERKKRRYNGGIS